MITRAFGPGKSIKMVVGTFFSRPSRRTIPTVAWFSSAVLRARLTRKHVTPWSRVQAKSASVTREGFTVTSNRPMPRETLERIKAEIGSLQFSAQYQQSPVPPEDNLVKRRTGVWIFTLAIPFPASSGWIHVGNHPRPRVLRPRQALRQASKGHLAPAPEKRLEADNSTDKISRPSRRDRIVTGPRTLPKRLLRQGKPWRGG